MYRFIASVTVGLFAAAPAWGSFHLMQIEQVIGGVLGNNAAQAIQLRQRAAGQNLVSFSSVWAADSAGANRVLLLDITANVANSAGGSRILLSTTAFNTLMNGGGGPAYSPDFTLTTPIPAAYLAAGRLTFEQDGGTVSTPGPILWSLAWGGAAYTGPHTGTFDNDANGNFGPAFGSALPTGGSNSVLFAGAFSALSTNNLADYGFSTGSATVIRNNGGAFTVLPEPTGFMLLALGGVFALCRRR